MARWKKSVHNVFQMPRTPTDPYQLSVDISGVVDINNRFGLFNRKKVLSIYITVVDKQTLTKYANVTCLSLWLVCYSLSPILNTITGFSVQRFIIRLI